MLSKAEYKEFTIRKYSIKSKSLLNNFPKDPVKRDIITIERNIRDDTPALIGLAGFFGSSQNFLNHSYLGHDFLSVLRNISVTGKIGSFLIILPDTMTSYFGNQYINSTAVGNYEDFISKDVVQFIKEKFGNKKIGLFGKSSGGFGSYTLGARHPEKFSGFIDVAGDSGFEYCYLRDFPAAISELSSKTPGKFMKDFANNPHPNHSELNTMNVIAMSAFYSPNRASKLGFDFPFDQRYHTLDQQVWERWLTLDPLRNVEEFRESLSDEKIILQVGRRDEFSINIGMNGLSKKMDKLGITHSYKEYDEGHMGIDYLYEESLPILIKALSR